MQCHNYISDVYNKPNLLKIGWKLSKLWLFKKYMYHYQHNVMGERADCGKMATMCGRSRLRCKTSSLYIYLWHRHPIYPKEYRSPEVSDRRRVTKRDNRGRNSQRESIAEENLHLQSEQRQGRAANSHGVAVWLTPDKISLQGFLKSWQLWKSVIGHTCKLRLAKNNIILSAYRVGESYFSIICHATC